MMLTAQCLPLHPIDVLVVEDDRGLSDLLAHALRRAGLTIAVASDVVGAKRLLARGRYKVLVLDLMLPDGTGFDILSLIKAESVLPPQIMVMPAADASLLEGFDRSVVKTVTVKPFDVEHLVASVRILARDQAARR
jgi:DNA-binding response OmpR family regulator